MRPITAALTLTSWALLIALVLLVRTASAQTANQWYFQKKNTSAGFTGYGVTPIAGRAFGLDGSGNPAMLTISGGSGLENILSSITGDTITFTGTLTAPREITWRDLAGTVAFTSDLSAYLTSATAATTYQPLDSDLTSVAALTTTSYGRSLLTQADATAARSTLGLGTLATQTATITDYLTTATASATYAPLASPTFTGTVTIPGGASISGYVTTADPYFNGTLTWEHVNTTLGTQTSTLSIPDELASMAWTTPAESGRLLTNNSSLNGSNISSGIVPAERLGTGSSISTKFLRGDNTYQAISGGGDALVASTLDQFADVTQTAGKTLAITDNTTLAGGSHSGTNTGDQTITLTGDVTGSGTSSFATSIAAGSVTLADMADMATASLIYRKTAGTGAPEVNTLATLKTDLALTGTNSGDQTTITGNAGTATALQTPRAIYGNNFDGSAALTQIIAAAYGGTGNGFTDFTGPSSSTKTFTLPNATATILTSNAAVTVAQGGTGRATSTTAYGLLAAGTTATGAHQTLSAGATTDILVGGGASALPVWTTATGTGSPVRAGSPTLSGTVTLSGLTSNGFVKTSGGTGALSVDTATYLTTTGNGSSLTGITQSQISGLTTTDRASFANVRPTHSTLTYAATTDIDLDGNGFQTVTLTGTITFTTSNRAAGRSKTIRIVGDTSSRSLTFPAGWTWIGAAAPTALAANKDAILTITAFGTADSDIVAAYAVEP